MRKNISKEDFRVLRNKLKVIAGKDALSPIEKLNESMFLINGFQDELKKQVRTVSFKDQMEEIYFFKFEKPEYYALKIYHVALFTLRNEKPAGTDEMIRAYLQDELAFLSRFFKQHAFYYGYYRAGFTEMDESLFLRGKLVSSPLFTELPELDADFSTGGDYLFAKFIAYESLQEYLVAELKKLDAKNTVMMSAAGNGKQYFEWTGEVVNVVELGYALYVSRQLNDAKASLGEIFRWLGESFGMELSIPANRFREIRRRKRISRTHFIDLLRDRLERYMDGEDSQEEP